MLISGHQDPIFSNGPIDGDDFEAPEGLLNAWPLDEDYITGLIQDTGFTISTSAIEGKNEAFTSAGQYIQIPLLNAMQYCSTG